MLEIGEINEIGEKILEYMPANICNSLDNQFLSNVYISLYNGWL